MKKLLMFLCCVFALGMFGGAYAGVCGSNTVITVDVQTPHGNEFLFSSKAALDEAYDKFNYVTNRTFNISKGKVYECDDEDGCRQGSMIWAPNGFYVNDYGDVGKQLLMCVRAGNMNLSGVGYGADGDVWLRQGFSECTNDFVKSGKKIDLIKGSREGACYRNGSKICCVEGEGYDCFQAAARGEPANWNGTVCNCGDEHTQKKKKKKCDANKKTPKSTPVTPNLTPKKSQNQIDCENAGGVWHGVANGEAGPETCICKDTSKYYDKSKKRCLPKNNVPVEPTPVEPENPQKVKCENSGEAHWNANLNECICNDENKVWNDGKGVCEYGAAYEACINAGEIWDGKNCTCRLSGYEWNGTKCEKGNGARLQNISSASAWLTNKWKLFEADKTVWKNKEGKFNTARLASDSIAGVVLGTAGGLITSNIVKKNQVKDGFDDVSCTIGGQYVADWDDEFTVGIR